MSIKDKVETKCTKKFMDFNEVVSFQRGHLMINFNKGRNKLLSSKPINTLEAIRTIPIPINLCTKPLRIFSK